MSDFPKELFYSPSHMWVRLLEDGSAHVGLTQHAQAELGDVVFVELPTPQDRFTQGQECGVIESVKSTSDLCCPLRGKVLGVNQKLQDHPEWVNQDPYGNGWLFLISPEDKADLAQLMDAAGYENMLQSEASHKERNL